MAESISGTERAAILLMSLGEADAAEVLKLMGPKEVQKIGSVMATLRNVSRKQVEAVLDEFGQLVEEQTHLGVGNEDYIRRVLVSALGAERAGGVIDRVLLGHNSKGLEALKWMDARAVGEIVRLEHPQIIAIVLAYLDPDHAAQVLQYLPEANRPDILLRIATLDGIQPQALAELDEIMERQFEGSANVKASSVGGFKSAANILNYLDSASEAKITESIKRTDEVLGEKIQELMFVFDNLLDIDDRGIQTLLREVSTDTLVVALKGANRAITEKILRNMSKRGGEILRDDLEAKGPVRVSEVEAAQKEILGVARRLADAGTLSLGGKGGEQYV